MELVFSPRFQYPRLDRSAVAQSRSLIQITEADPGARMLVTPLLKGTSNASLFRCCPEYVSRNG